MISWSWAAGPAPSHVRPVLSLSGPSAARNLGRPTFGPAPTRSMSVQHDNPRSGPGAPHWHADERLPRSDRLRRRGDFLRVQNGSRRVHTAHFIILLAPDANSGVASRLGVTVGRRIGCAVRRNRIKRLVREVYRRNRALFPRDCDVVLVARSGAERLDYGSVRDELVRAQAALARLQSGRPSPQKSPTSS